MDSLRFDRGRMGFILPDAKRVRPGAEPMPAQLRFDSQIWRTWRNATRGLDPPPPLRILAGARGFILPETLVGADRAPLTLARFDAMACDADARLAFGVIELLEFVEPFDDVVVAGSGLYIDATRHLLAGAKALVGKRLHAFMWPVGRASLRLRAALRWYQPPRT